MLPPYTVRESAKARRIRLQITPQAEVEVIIPQGFDPERLPSLLETKTLWLQRTLQQVREQRQQRGAATYPDQLQLRALHRSWEIRYRSLPISEIHLLQRSDHLELVGQVEDWPLCGQTLRQWLRAQAKIHLETQLRSLSAQLELPFSKLTIRSQKTRWGSCSQRHAISLNDKLLFLPADLVCYVLVHELCHTQHLDHSPEFWELVNRHEPRSRDLDAQLRQARIYLPAWVEG